VAWLSLGLALWLWRRRRHGAQEVFDSDSRQLLDELRKAIAERRLAWVYQPQYDVRTQRIVGAEMLARWHHPQRGAIPPDTFIQLAERAGII
jgi:EAL domain-containing protein (putative c-di-GMP-specific phosphodiesterase class I)